jgi:hypothetical protein
MNVGINLPNDDGLTDDRDKVFENFFKVAWDHDIVIVLAAGNDGIGPTQTLNSSMYFSE